MAYKLNRIDYQNNEYLEQTNYAELVQIGENTNNKAILHYDAETEGVGTVTIIPWNLQNDGTAQGEHTIPLSLAVNKFIRVRKVVAVNGVDLSKLWVVY